MFTFRNQISHLNRTVYFLALSDILFGLVSFLTSSSHMLTLSQWYLLWKRVVDI